MDAQPNGRGGCSPGSLCSVLAKSTSSQRGIRGFAHHFHPSRGDRFGTKQQPTVSEGSISASDAERLFESTSPIDHRVRAIEAGLHRLPSAQREVLTLKIWGELTFDEIARELDISHNTAASRYRYALAALCNEMNMAQMS